MRCMLTIAVVCTSAFAVLRAWADDRVLPLPIHTSGIPQATKLHAATGDTFALSLLASLEFSDAYGMAFGDTDHDGNMELAFTGGRPTTYRIWEHRGGNVYSLEASGSSYLITYALADLDQDGRGELIGQTSGYVQVFESVNAQSHPSQLVWTSPYLSNVVGSTAVGDTDGDGKMEIIQSVNGSGGLVIFECIGDNTFSLVFSGSVSGTADTGEKLIADLDGDGRPEIALCGSPGYLNVLESTADNVWVRTFATWTGMWNAHAIDGGSDTDGNGKPEIFVTGNMPNYAYTTMVYEASGNDSFTRVATLSSNGSGVGSLGCSVCNVDASGSEEFLMATPAPTIQVFRAIAPGVWSLVGTVYGPGGGGDVRTFDLNKNGIPEVIWPYTTTRIFEHRDTVTEVPVGAAWQPAALTIGPSPCQSPAALQFTLGDRTAVAFTVFDPRGRIVHRQSVAESGRPVIWQPQGLPAGSYFVKIEDIHGRTLATGKAAIVH